MKRNLEDKSWCSQRKKSNIDISYDCLEIHVHPTVALQASK